MGSLDEFRTLLESNAAEAFSAYSLRIDCDSLDFSADAPGHDDFKTVKIGFTYENDGGVDVIRLGPDAGGKDLSYLPWKNASEGGIARTTLNGTGPRYFSTSQLDGCRFTIEYHDAECRSVTVQHLAGDAGGSGAAGSEIRDALEASGIKPPVVLRRRLSIGTGEGKVGKAGRTLRAARPNTVYYDGGKAAVFGYRNADGAWVFYGAETDSRTGKGAGLKNLVTGAAVSGSLKVDAG